MKLFGLAAALALTVAAATPAVAADNKTAPAGKAPSARRAAPAKPAVTKTTKPAQLVRSKAIRTARRQLSRKWVWKRDAKRFDGMFRK